MSKLRRRNKSLLLRSSFVRRTRPKSAAMRKRKKQVTEEIKYFDLLPTDLITNIFSKLPSAKSIAQCRCVSKLWSSIISRENNKQLFPIKSPKLLITFSVENKLFFYTTPEPQDPHDISSLVATHHHTYTTISHISGPVQGFVCYQRFTEDSSIEVVVSNPVTGQYLTFPKMSHEVIHAKSFLCYDAMEKQFKVLSVSLMFSGTSNDLSLEYHVLTVENGSGNWRKIECCLPLCDPVKEGICINGVLYLTSPLDKNIIGCFDVGSEKFDFVRWTLSTVMINYKDKLGMVDNSDYKDFVLWVLEDYKEQKWSKHVYEKPLEWRIITRYLDHAVGMNGRGDVLLCTRSGAQLSLYVYYYNPEKNTLVKLRVLEGPAFESSNLSCAISSYGENIMLL